MYHLKEFLLRFIEIIGNLFPSYHWGNKIRGAMYKPFLKKCGTNFQVDINVKLSALHNIEVGDNVYIGYGSWINAGRKIIKFGNDVMLSPYVVMVTGNHQFDGKTYRYKSDENPTDIIIGDGTWIASHSIILKNTVVGNSSLIGALSLVNNDIESFTISAGNPAKIIKKVTND